MSEKLRALMGRMQQSVPRSVAMHVTLGVLGVATLLPWNIFITETQFFEVRAHQPPTFPRMADAIKSIIPLCFQVPNVGALLVAVKYQQYLTMDQQVMYPLIISFGVILLAGVMAAFVHMPGTWLMMLTLPAVVLLGLTSAFLQGGVYALAAQRGAAFIQSCMTGQALAGLAVALLSFATQAAGPVDTSGSTPTPEQVSAPAMHYFLGSAAVVAGSVAGYLHIRKQLARQKVEILDSSLSEPLLAEDGISAAENGGACNGHHANGIAADENGTTANGGGVGDTDKYDSTTAELPLRELLLRLWGYCAVVVATFGVTLLVFPAITSSVCSERNPAIEQRGHRQFDSCAASSPAGRFFGDLFVPFSFVMFNLGDVLGRMAAGIGPWKDRSPPVRMLAAYAALRLLIPAAILFCNVVTPAGWVVPPLLSNDLFPISLVLLLGLTNGHLGMLALMHAPSAVPSSARRQCGPVMSFSVVFGLISGSLLSFVLVEALHLHAGSGSAANGLAAWGLPLLATTFVMPR